MKITKLSCFCSEAVVSGNPAGVVDSFSCDANAQQQLASQLNLPVTVFVNFQDQLPILRFFYPECEMPLCIHGALGAGFVLMQKFNKNSMQVLTHNQQRLSFIRKSTDLIYLAIDQGSKLPFEIKIDEVDQMLNLELNANLDNNLPFCVASIGSPKLLIPLKKLETLRLLKPNFNDIKQWSLKNGVNGLYVYTSDVQDKSYRFVARGFNPKGGKDEDAATGVAAGALYQALNFNQAINILQGENIGSPSCIRVYGENNQIFIGGKVKEC